MQSEWGISHLPMVELGWVELGYLDSFPLNSKEGNLDGVGEVCAANISRKHLMFLSKILSLALRTAVGLMSPTGCQCLPDVAGLSWLFFEMGSHYVAQADFELMILMSRELLEI